MIDSHAHYDDEKFESDRNEIIQKAICTGVTHIVNPGTDMESSEDAIALADTYPQFFAAVGFHPHNALKCTPGALIQLEKMCSHPKVVAIGEIGLDYHYDFSPREQQRSVLLEHIHLAKRVNKPIILHDRESHRDLMDMLTQEKHQIVGGVLHCFSGSKELAEEAVKLGLYIGIGGSLTFKNARKTVEVVSHIPLDRLLIETDCPYLAPVPHRGERNWSGLMVHVLQKMADILQISVEEIEKATTENAKKLFNLPA